VSDLLPLEREVKSGRGTQRTCRAPRSLVPRLSGVSDIVRISAFPFETGIEPNNIYGYTVNTVPPLYQIIYMDTQ